MKILKPLLPAALFGLVVFALAGITAVGADPGADRPQAGPESDKATVDPLGEYDLVPNKDHPGFIARVYKWTKDIARFDAGLRQLVATARVPSEEEFKKRLESKTGDLEIITDGYGGVVDFDAAEGTVQYVVNERFGSMNIEWEFELANDTEIYWNKSTKLIPKIARTAQDGKQESEQPLFVIRIAKSDAGPFHSGDRVRLKASIDDFSRFRKGYTRATGLVAIYYLEEGPNPVFDLRLDEAEVTLLEGEEKVGEDRFNEANRQPYKDELPDEVSAMAGLWRIDLDFDRLLEAPAENNRHPNSLRLSFAVPGAPGLRKETISLIEELFVKKMKHTIVAVGKWEAEKESKLAADRDSNCFVTTKSGATYMWFGTPDKMLVGVEISHIRVSARKSLLILDGNSMLPPRMRKPENVRVYVPTDPNVSAADEPR